MLPKYTQNMAKREKYRNVTKIHANSRQNVKNIGMWPKYTQIHWLLLLCGSHVFKKVTWWQDRMGAGTRCWRPSCAEIALRWSKRKRVALLDMEVCRDYHELATDSEGSAWFLRFWQWQWFRRWQPHQLTAITFLRELSFSFTFTSDMLHLHLKSPWRVLRLLLTVFYMIFQCEFTLLANQGQNKVFVTLSRF